MDFAKEYEQKLTTADEAVKIIKSGDWVDYGWCNGTPDALDKALAKRTDELKDINLRGGILLKPLVSVTQIFDVPVYVPADTDHGALLSKYSTGIVCAGHAMRGFSVSVFVFFSVFSAVYIALYTPFSPFTTPNPSCAKDGLRRQRRLVRSDRLLLPFPDIHVSRRAALSV